ncbi:MAG TPA: EAL domain-containing protein [Solirubrobacteraceae bacterium]
MSSVLVVDDRATNRDLLRTILGYAGHAVQEASSGPEALTLVRIQPPDLIIADILMPAMDGYELVRALRSRSAGLQIPVIFCTATYALQEVRRLAKACGVSRVLVKPLEPQNVIQVVAEALEAGLDSQLPLPPEAFHQEQLRVLNAKLIEKIEELEHSKRQTAESLTLLETLQATAPVGFGFVDRDFRMVHMNDTLAAVNALPREEQLGRTVAEVVPMLWPQLEPTYRHVLETGNPIVDQELSRPSPSSPDETRYWLASYYPVRLNGEIIGIGLVVVDTSERRQAEQFRSVVMDTMAEGLYVIDGDGCLTFINAAACKMLGWTGDELSAKPAHATLHSRRPDGSPLPQEECQILGVLKGGQSIAVSNDVLTRKDGTILPVSYSAAPLAGASDMRGVVVAFRDVTEEQAERTRMQTELDSISWVGRTRDAIDEGRLVLYAQPIASLTQGDPSEELLLRMFGRNGEVILPERFLPAAEKFGLIVEIDRWVVIQAIRRAASGRRVQANLSGKSIVNVELLSVIEQQLQQTRADPANIVFEITETVLMRDIDVGKTFAYGLVELGCAIALDDFGTGFGSFTYLKKLPIEFLKIDIEFVRNLGSNPANQQLVKAIVGLAKGFHHRTIAEGVEDEETLTLLRDYGVDFAQGFHIGHPAPIEDFSTV